jgi:predicted permease
MKALARVRSWCRSAFRRSRLEQELDEERRFHIGRYVDDLRAAGVPAGEARRLAHVEFGAVEAHKEECREAVGLRLLDELAGDLRYAGRQLRRSPGFTTIAVLSLALAIGANAAIFSLMEAALWKTIRVRDPEQLRLFSWISGPNRVMNGINGNMTRTVTGGSTSTSFSYPVFLELQRQNDVFESVFGFKPIGRVTAVIDGEPELIAGELVSGNFFDGVGVRPLAGRPIAEADDTRGSEPVGVIGHGFWARRFGLDPAAIGKRIGINGVSVTIVGVNPPAFTGVEPGQAPDIFLPMQLQPVAWQRRGDVLLNNADVWWVLVMGRLRPAISEANARTRLDAVLQRAVSASLPERADRDRPRLELLDGSRGLDELREDFLRPLVVLFSLVVVVLLIACANVANLLLARATNRQREISLRRALGATRWRVARQLLTEGLLLALIGGAAGVLLGYSMRNGIPNLLATSWQPGPLQAEFNGRVLGLSVAATLATGILFSLAPAWQSARVDISAALRGASRTVLGLPRWWHGKPLVALQICLSVLLLVAAGLFVRTLSNLAAVSLGFEPDRVLLFTIAPPRTRYPDERRSLLFDRIHQRVGEVPGIETATLSSDTLLAGGSSQTGIAVDLSRPEERRLAWVNDVGYDFFETMGIPILLGRGIGRLDHAGSEPVAVVNQQFVRELFPGQNPLGKTFRNGQRVLRIVGVSADARYDRLRSPFPPTFYRPYLQDDGENLDAMTYEVRTAADQASVVAAIREAVRAIDADLPVFDVRTQDEQIEAGISQEKMFVALAGSFAAVALVLACIGIYGLMANSVARRTNEIGIRIALGAGRRGVLAMILREVLLLAAIGTAAGVATATGLSRYVESLLFGIEPADPLTIGGAVVLMCVIALLASWVPARRASRLEPMTALRHD